MSKMIDAVVELLEGMTEEQAWQMMLAAQNIKSGTASVPVTISGAPAAVEPEIKPKKTRKRNGNALASRMLPVMKTQPDTGTSPRELLDIMRTKQVVHATDDEKAIRGVFKRDSRVYQDVDGTEQRWAYRRRRKAA